jgi:dihydrodipicolinate synthase/N-acetylneuraminate lyase
MARLELFCRIATPFTKTGEFDEEALRKFLQRFIKSKIGIYLGSAGGGESHALTWQELQRIYEIGVEECGGKIPVYANPPEQYTVRATREYISQAIEAGVDLVSIYGLASRHGMKPTDLELALYFKEVLAGVKHPMSLAVNQPIMGYMPKPAVIADVCNKHHQIQAINLSHGSDGFFLQLKDRLKRDIPIYVHLGGSLNKLTMGARGIFGTEANLIPKTQRSYLDAYESRDFRKLGRVYADLTRFNEHVLQWYPSVARAIKMGMRLLKLPGGEGGLREPYRMPPAKEYKRFADGLLRLGIPEIEAQARAAGLRIPSGIRPGD